jgi:hypothetical protein
MIFSEKPVSTFPDHALMPKNLQRPEFGGTDFRNIMLDQKIAVDRSNPYSAA